MTKDEIAIKIMEHLKATGSELIFYHPFGMTDQCVTDVNNNVSIYWHGENFHVSSRYAGWTGWALPMLSYETSNLMQALYMVEVFHIETKKRYGS